MFGSLSASSALGEDAFCGTWVMDVAASWYATGDLPQAMTIEIDTANGHEHYRSRTVRRNQQVATAEYTADYDGRLAMVVGDSGMLTPVALKRVSANTIEATYQRAFQTIARSTRVVSADALSMTITTTISGEPQNTVNVGVYKRGEHTRAAVAGNIE
jgi:type II secretory pathway predicted ATPase ExeA